MTAIPFPALSSPDQKAESGGRMVNAYPEKLPDGRIARRRVPGLRQLLGELPHDGCRGFLNVNGVLLVAIGSHLFKIERTGGAFVATDLGTLGGTGPVFFARNNKSPTPDIVAVTDSTAYVVDLTTGIGAYPDGDVGSPNSVGAQGGYLIFTYGDARMRHTGLNSTAINTLDTAFAESRNDGLLRVINYGGDILAFGPSSIEIWRNTGNSPGFAFTYVDTIERGLMHPLAIAGYEPGFAAGVMFLGDDGLIYQMQGYKVARASNHTIERQIADVVDRSKFEALVYVHDGHACWALSCDEWTWVYDISTGAWYERASHLAARWRASRSVWCFDRWVLGDAATGFLSTIAGGAHDELGQPLVASITSATMSPFPRGARWKAVELDLMAGVGLAPGSVPIETNPTAMVSWSLDGGVSFGSPVLRELGVQGNYTARQRVNNLGRVSNRGAQIRIAVSDPAPFTLFGGDAEFSPLVV